MAGPSSFERYQIDEVQRVEPLGRVLRARLPGVNRAFWIVELCPPVALAPEERGCLLDQFDAECRALTEVTDPRVLPPCDLGHSDSGSRFAAFERPEAAGFMPLSDCTGLSADQWVGTAVEVASALGALENAGIRWSSFRPENCFVTESGAVRVLPLELANVAVTAQLPRAFCTVDPALGAPELQLGKGPHAASLVFSLAAWLYAKIAGAAASSPALTVLGGGRLAPLWSFNPAVSALVDDVVQNALAADPGRRYASVEQFGAALQPLVKNECASPAAVPAETAEPDEAEAPGWHWPAWAVALGAAGWALGWALAHAFPMR